MHFLQRAGRLLYFGLFHIEFGRWLPKRVLASCLKHRWKTIKVRLLFLITLAAFLPFHGLAGVRDRIELHRGLVTK